MRLTNSCDPVIIIDAMLLDLAIFLGCDNVSKRIHAPLYGGAELHFGIVGCFIA
jgi:hypothetical protein